MAEEKITGKQTTEQQIQQAEVLDPFTKQLADSFALVLGPEVKTEESEFAGPITIGESVMMTESARAGGSEAEKKAEEERKKAESEAAAKADEEKKKKEAEAEAAKKAGETRKVVLRKVVEQRLERGVLENQKAGAAELERQDAAAKKTEEEKKQKAEEDYIRGLTAEQQDEISLARFAEGKGRQGLTAEMIGYFRKIDQFIEEHPELNEESDEFTKFIADNRPKLGDSERRRLEREMITEEAAAKAHEELKPKVEAQAQRLKEIETQPLIEAAEAKVTEAISGTPREGLNAIDKSVTQSIREKGYEAALAEYPIEAPVVKGTIEAARAWLKLSNGLVSFDDQNPVHSWLAGFVAREGQNMKRQSREAQTLKDGRTFLPMNEFMDLQRKDPASASRHWTFDDEMVVEMLASNAVIAVNQQVQQLSGAGWERKSKVSPKTEVKAVEGGGGAGGNGDGGSPRAGGKALPGASDGQETKAGELGWMVHYPEAGKVVGG